MGSKKRYMPKQVVVAGRVEVVVYIDVLSASIAGMDAFTQELMELIEQKATSVAQQRKHKTAVRSVTFHVPHARQS